MRPLARAVVFVAVAIFSATNGVEAQTTGVITGVVVDESGALIGGAQVALAGADGAGRSIATNEKGTFTLAGVPLGSHVLVVTRNLFAATRVEVRVAGADDPMVRIVLRIQVVREDVTVTATQSTDKLSIDAPASTGSRLALTPRETPASVTIVERATIEQRGASDTQEILSSVPGVTAAAPPGFAGQVSYRGFSGGQIAQLFNGITVQYDAIAARPIDSWIYDKVEVIGGPSTFLFGAGAVGGSINYVTRLADRDRNGGQVRLSYGSHATREIDFGVNRTLGQGVIRNHVRFDLSRSGSSGYVDENKRAALTSALSLVSDFGSRVSHTLALEYQNERVDRPYWGTPLLVPTMGQGRINPATRFANYNTSDGIYEQTVVWVRSVIEYRLTPRASLRNTAYHYDARRDYRNVEVYRYNASNSLVERSSPLLQRHDQQLIGDRVEFRYGGRFARLPSDWAGGLDVSYNEQTRFPLSLSSTVSSVDPVTFSTERFFDIPGMVPGFIPDRTNEVSTVALFAENRTKLFDTVSLVTGLRRDRVVLEGTNQRPITVSAVNPAYFKNIYSPVTGRIGLTYAFVPAANLYLQYSTAADPPAGILTTASFAQVRTFDLATGRQTEAGVKLDYLGGRGVATAAVYRITRKNLSVADPLNPGTTIPVGQQSSRGFELASSVRVVSATLIQGNYAYVDATFDDFTENVGGVAVSRAGNRPSNTPTHVANLWLTVTVAPRVELGIDGRWVSSRFADNANTISDGTYAIYGAFASYRPTANTLVTARARNFTDEVYARSLTGTPMFFLGAPRTFELAFKVGF